MDEYQVCKSCNGLTRWDDKTKSFVCPHCNRCWKPTVTDRACLEKSLDIFPGKPVMVFRNSRYERGIVIRRYGKMANCIAGLVLGPYADLVDVRISDGSISRGHFTWAVRNDNKDVGWEQAYA